MVKELKENSFNEENKVHLFFVPYCKCVLKCVTIIIFVFLMFFLVIKIYDYENLLKMSKHKVVLFSTVLYISCYQGKYLLFTN